MARKPRRSVSAFVVEDAYQFVREIAHLESGGVDRGTRYAAGARQAQVAEVGGLARPMLRLGNVQPEGWMAVHGALLILVGCESVSVAPAPLWGPEASSAARYAPRAPNSIARLALSAHD
jgi:hypothetical protein